MYKFIRHKISRKAVLLSIYLFLLLFLALYGRLGFQALNQVILWAFGPLLAFYILEPNIGNYNKVPKEYYLYLSMVVFAFLGYMNIEDESSFYRYLQVFVANFILMVIVYFAINNIKEWELAWKMVGLVGLTVAVVGFFVEAPSIETDEYFRLSGITGNANGTANYARVGMVAGLVMLQFTERKLYRLILWVSVLFLAYTILLTASRGNFANMVFILGGYFAFKYFRGWKLLILLFLLFVFGNIIIYFSEQFLSDFYLFDRLTRNDSVTSAVDDEARLQIYALAWKYFLEYPFFGVGLNQFKLYADGKISHTDVLDILVQLGVIAGTVYVSIYVRLYFRIRKLKKFILSKRDQGLYHLLLLVFFSEIFFGISNPNWFTQLQMVVLSLIIVYATKLKTTENIGLDNAHPASQK